jgi:beta-lactamase regulating signal transducer with metallopeptidase domain
MGQFAYGFSLTLLHSLWQSALLLLVYGAVTVILKRHTPSSRRNFLYLLLLTQLILSSATFWIYYSGSENLYEPLLALDYANVFTAQPFFQTLAPWMLGVYLLTVACKSFFLLYHWNKFKANCRSTWTRPSIDMKVFTMMKAHEFGIRRKVAIWYSNAVTTPITFGFFKPVILMPVALLNQLTIEEAETLIVHELTHIRNNDYLLNYLLIITDTLFFFNPFLKIIASQLKLEREKNCDVQVLHYKYSSITYAETLLKAARFRPQSSLFQLAAVSKNKQLLNRILFFTSENNLNFRKRNYSAVTYFLVLVVFCINLFTIAEIKRNRTRRSYIAYTPTLMPGYNADKVFSFLADGSLEPSAATAVNVQAPTEQIVATAAAHKTYKHALRRVNTAWVATAENPEVQLTDANHIIPVAMTETQSEEVKEIIVKEENSVSGRSITKAYKMIFRDGRWIAEPAWMFTETKLIRDSIQILKDSIAKPFHIIQ